ncbi:MAG: hypothetical protein AB1486_10690 [Planctomycetota bacterium]
MRYRELDLSFIDLAGKEMTSYRDGVKASACQIETGLAPPRDGRLKILLRSGGGFIAHIGVERQYAGWR